MGKFNKVNKTLMFLVLVFLLILTMFNSVYSDLLEYEGVGVDNEKKAIINNKDKYITVGKENCEFKTIKEALSEVDSKRNIIYVMDKIHTETSIIIADDMEVVIKGFGARETIIQGACQVDLAEDRIFLIKPEGKLIIEGLTVCNGKVDKVPRGGGGFLNRGILIINNCIISNNMATYGIGIYTEKYLEMTNSMIIGSRNIRRPVEETRLGTGCWGSGGGIKVEYGEAKLVNCSIIDNVAYRSGGGIKVSCPAIATLTNCTIAENESGANGGGIGISGDVTLTHCTITKNTSKLAGGIYVTGDVKLKGNIIAQNEKGDLIVAKNQAFVGEVIENEYNLVGDGKYESFLSGNPELERISEEDEFLVTYAPKANSMVIDAITTTVSFVEEDQRGITREEGEVDIGAYEFDGNKLLNKYLIIFIIVTIGIVIILYYSFIKNSSSF